MNNNEKIPERWKRLGIEEPQQIIDTINEAFLHKDKLDSNIYIGNTRYGNICICLTSDNKIENAFPVKTTKEEYFQIKSGVEKLELGNKLYAEVLSLFLAIDIKNHKEELINNFNQNNSIYAFDLFNCYISNDITIIDIGAGKVSISTNIIKNYLFDNSIKN